MLTDSTLEQILDRLPGLTIGVLGDLFLDRYLEIDVALTEPSLETGLDAFQVVRVRASPGAAGTVMNNLVALGLARVCPITVIGDDGEGHELRQVLKQQSSIDGRGITVADGRRTPAYTKPLLLEAGKLPRELNRLDIKNRRPLAPAAEDGVLKALNDIWPQIEALVVVDQVSEPECGVVTTRVRQRLAELGESAPTKLVLADSRDRIGLFRSVCLKPNQGECAGALNRIIQDRAQLELCVWELASKVGRLVFCTRGENGILVGDPRPGRNRMVEVPAFPVQGPIDVVGAGDSTSAAIAVAIAAGASAEEAAAFGNLVASITIQQLGTTGTASPEQVRQRWREIELQNTS